MSNFNPINPPLIASDNSFLSELIDSIVHFIGLYVNFRFLLLPLVQLQNFPCGDLY